MRAEACPHQRDRHVRDRGVRHAHASMQGGAIAYAAAVASAYGVRACIVTAAAPNADLSVFRGHELHVVRTERTLTFEHSYTWWGECPSSPETPLVWFLCKRRAGRTNCSAIIYDVTAYCAITVDSLKMVRPGWAIACMQLEQVSIDKSTCAIWAGNKRKLRVTAQPNVTLIAAHVPLHCRRARTLLLGPLTPTDLDAAGLINARQGLLHGPHRTHRFLAVHT